MFLRACARGRFRFFFGAVFCRCRFEKKKRMPRRVSTKKEKKRQTQGKHARHTRTVSS
jgi:hypothetical protein